MVQVVLDEMKLAVGFGVICIVGDGLSVEPEIQKSPNIISNSMECLSLFDSPPPYGPRTITVGAGVLDPILLITGTLDDCLIGVVYEEIIDGFLVPEYVGRAGVGPLT